ncbi:AraC family transcriptional regulator [Latilactobacillus sakei]|uniref:AraC family transcriptional regulator n=1 Tax=Latilactobacillus sakei TaxID=1599 RepID=UPI003F534BBB
MDETLATFLKQETPIETLQRTSHRFVPDFPTATVPESPAEFKLESQYFFKNKDIYINKHNRYAAYPKHSHDFMELNYIYSGECTEIIDGQKVHLKQHDILLIDIGSEHSIEPLGKNDILINILFQNQNINLHWLEQMKSNRSILFDFLINNHTEAQKNFLLFQDNLPKINNVIEQLLTEYYFPADFSDVIISHYLIILLTELMRNYDPSMVRDTNQIPNDLLNRIFAIIEKDYTTLTLTALAEKLSYTKNYLSNFIKAETHVTFTELLNKQKLLKAHLLISSTQRTIDDIIAEIGYTNKNYFYKEYKKAYHELPSETRKHKADDTLL